MRYKVGDKVRVRNDLIENKEYGGYSFVQKMKSLMGGIVTIKEILSKSYGIEEMGYYWTDEMLEPIGYNKDKVSHMKIIQNGNTTIVKMNNKEGYSVCNPEIDEYNGKEGIRIAVCRLLDIEPFKEEKKIEEYSTRELLDELAKRCK